MHVSLGRAPATPSGDHPVDHLLACHGRIRSFMALARAIATREEATDSLVRDAARDVKRYFTEALPRHAADEDESLCSRLTGRDPALDTALARMTAEHATIDTLLAELCAHCDALVADPRARRARRKALLALLDTLDARWEAHLGLEEREIFPVLRTLDATSCEAIRTEMRARRSG